MKVALVRIPGSRPRTMAGIEGFWSDVGHVVVKAATLPITAPLTASKYIITEGIGVAKGVLSTVKETAAALKPPPPPPAPVADYFGVGGAGSSLAALGSAGTTTSSSKLPIIVGGVALVGLVLVAVLTRKKKATT